MLVRTSRKFRTVRIKTRTVRQTKASLQDLPEKKGELVSLQEAIHQLRFPIEAALAEGYSYPELAAILQRQGIFISAPTLRRYLFSDRRQVALSKDSKNSKSKSAENPLNKSSITVEVSVPFMQYRDIITIEPGKRSGKPCIRGMRITVYDILEYLAGGMTEAEILEDFSELTSEDIKACLAFAADREKKLFVVSL